MIRPLLSKESLLWSGPHRFVPRTKNVAAPMVLSFFAPVPIICSIWHIHLGKTVRRIINYVSWFHDWLKKLNSFHQIRNVQLHFSLRIKKMLHQSFQALHWLNVYVLYKAKEDIDEIHTFFSNFVSERIAARKIWKNFIRLKEYIRFFMKPFMKIFVRRGHRRGKSSECT